MWKYTSSNCSHQVELSFTTFDPGFLPLSIRCMGGQQSSTTDTQFYLKTLRGLLRWCWCWLFQYPFVRYSLPIYFTALQKRWKGKELSPICVASPASLFFNPLYRQKRGATQKKGRLWCEKLPVFSCFTHPTVRSKCWYIMHNFWCTHRIWKWAYRTQQPVKSGNL